MDQRFGLFIHWGPVSLRGTEIAWSRGHEVPTAEYDSLYKEFNPALFNADAWAKAAKDAGMKYLVIVAKHHDGFCLWPTKISGYNIMNTPFKKDVVGELATACKRYDLKFGIYFTVMDWHDPHYGSHNGVPQTDSLTNMAEFVRTMKSELKELVTNYHPFLLWFDGNWEKPWKNEYATDVYSYLKALDPNLIINNRLGAGNDHLNLTPNSIGDYATPEQVIGALNMHMPWETCMTICNQWAWKANDKMKSLKECVQTLAKTAGGNGNLLFNVGPMPDGRIEQRQVTRLQEIGNWLKINGESIYGTKGGPFAPNNDFATTRKGNKLYIHIFNRKQDTLTLPLITTAKVKQAYFLNGAKIKYSQSASGSISIALPDQLPDSNDAVITIELNTSAEAIPVVSYWN